MRADVIFIAISAIQLAITAGYTIAGDHERALLCMVLAAIYMALAHLAFIIRYLRGMMEFLMGAVDKAEGADEKENCPAGKGDNE